MAAMPGQPMMPQQISPEQLQAMQQRFLAEAQAAGMTPQEYAQKLRLMAAQQQQAMQQQAQQQQAQGQQPGQASQQQQQQQAQAQQQMQQQMQQPVQQRIDQNQPPKPEAVAVANFLKSQPLKPRPCILQEKRRELFKVKRALRALQSPAYEKARAKNPLLPPVTDRVSAENTFKLLPLSMLALRVSKVDPNQNPAHGQPGHQHAKKQKSAKKGGVWTVKIEPQQDAFDQMHYVWFYEGSQWMQKLYAVGALIAVVAIVLFPLWPYFMRRGVWYLSMACLGLLAAFFGLAIVRLIIFVITVTLGPYPGIWIYPNLFEDVGFFDSFKPMWAWRETKESLAVKKAEKKAKKQARLDRKAGKGNGSAKKPAATAAQPQGPAETAIPESSKESSTTGAETSSGAAERRNLRAHVEEAEEE